MKPFRYSSISDFYKCPQLYKLKHIDGLDDGGGKSGDMAFGTCLHLGVQDLFEGGDGITVFKAYWDTFQTKEMEYSRYGWDDLLTLGCQLIAIFRDEHLHKFVVANDPDGQPMLERKFHTNLGGHAFSGTIDFVGTYKGVPSVIDWKTAAYPYDAHKLVVNEQTWGYAYAAQTELGYPVQQVGYGVAVKDPKNPRWQFRTALVTPESLTKRLDNMIAVCNTISGTTQYTRNPLSCVQGKRLCAFFQNCHGGQGSGGKEET